MNIERSEEEWKERRVDQFRREDKQEEETEDNLCRILDIQINWFLFSFVSISRSLLAEQRRSSNVSRKVLMILPLFRLHCGEVLANSAEVDGLCRNFRVVTAFGSHMTEA